MSWSGYIAGPVTLYIQADHVDAQGRDTGSVDRPEFRFANKGRLPTASTHVEVKVRQGKGRVEVVEQPESGNEYSAVVQITPAGNIGERYVLDFFWDRNVKRVTPR